MKTSLTLALLALGCVAFGADAPATHAGARQFRLSTVIEKERPELNETTKRLIAAWRKEPTEANLAALREQIAANYDRVLARKRAKLEELRQTARHASKVREMQDIVDEMVRDRESRIRQTLRRFTDPRLRPGACEAKEGWLPLIGGGETLSVAYAPVTNEAYARFLKATGRTPPKAWADGAMPAGKARHPVTGVTFADAVAYCAWLTETGAGALYRLPTEAEWAIAAGHMPKDADFNCGTHGGTQPVEAYADTRSACGAIDMWGNCWEWTSTAGEGAAPTRLVKGGSWRSARTDCRTEAKGVARAVDKGHDDVGFRVLREERAPARPMAR